MELTALSNPFFTTPDISVLLFPNSFPAIQAACPAFPLLRCLWLLPSTGTFSMSATGLLSRRFAWRLNFGVIDFDTPSGPRGSQRHELKSRPRRWQLPTSGSSLAFSSSTAISTFGKMNVLIRRWQGAGVNDLIGLSMPNSCFSFGGVLCRCGADLSELSPPRGGGRGGTNGVI